MLSIVQLFLSTQRYYYYSGYFTIVQGVYPKNQTLSDSFRAVLRSEGLKFSRVERVADALRQLVVEIQVVHHRKAQGQDLLRLEEVAQVRA